MHTECLDYADGKLSCEAYVAYDESKKTKRPCVVISHAWGGQGDFERDKARKLAQLGYVGFALDLYGKGVRGSSMEENAKLMQPFMDDRAMLRQRIIAAVETVKKHPMVDANRIGAMGYCFGGLCVLDLARSGTPGVKGVVAFHGMFNPPKLGKQSPITAKVLMLHGYDDPMATPKDVLAVAQELDDANADWQLHAYGRVGHAFTNPQMNMPEKGLAYNAAADRRSWIAMTNFFEEVFA
jgi:dienelactone hydrolase